MTRFYCENCGRRVSESDEVCPHCGAFFTAIKCPHCGYRGKTHEFGNGCPKCGYLANRPPAASRPSSSPDRHSRRTNRFDFWGKATGSNKKSRPEWLFFLVVAVMLVAFTVLSILYMNM